MVCAIFLQALIFFVTMASAVQADVMDLASKHRSWEFVQTARSGAFDGKTLTLYEASPRTIGFTDRPDRIIRAISTQLFVDVLWKENADSFAKDPPNAVLALEVDGEIFDAIVEISDVRYQDMTLTYTARLLSGKLPGRFNDPHMVIDSLIITLWCSMECGFWYIPEEVQE